MGKLFKKYKKGYTLFETILYIHISALIILIIISSIISLMQMKTKNMVVLEVSQQGYAAMEYISRSIRNARDVVSPEKGEIADILVLETYDTGSSITYSLDRDSIMLDESSLDPINITNSRVQVSNLKFTNLSREYTPGVIKIEFDISYASNSLSNEFQYTTSFQNNISLR